MLTHMSATESLQEQPCDLCLPVKLTLGLHQLCLCLAQAGEINRERKTDIKTVSTCQVVIVRGGVGIPAPLMGLVPTGTQAHVQSEENISQSLFLLFSKKRMKKFIDIYNFEDNKYQ